MQRTIRLYLILSISIIVSSSPCFSQGRQDGRRSTQARPSAPFLQYAKAYEETPYVTKVILRNGMTVLVDEFRLQPVVSVQMHVRAGYFDDPPQSPGIAKLVGSMVQKGSPDKSIGSYRQKVQALGGVSRSTTGFSTTLFEIVAPSNQWKRALNIQAEAILNPSFDSEEVKLEARLAESEARAILCNPWDFGYERLLQLAFDQARMGQNSTISDSSLDARTPESLSAFYRSLYVPSRMILVVSGDVSSSEVLNEVVRLFSKVASPPSKPTPPPPEASHREFRFNSVRGNVANPLLFFGFHSVPENDEDSRALEVASAILGLGDASVFSSRLKDEKKLLLSAQSRMTFLPESGFLSVWATSYPATVDRAELAILTEVELLKREEPSDVDIERAVAQLERVYWTTLETVTGRAQMLAHFESGGDWKRMDRRIEDLRRVKGPDIQRVVKKYLSLQNCSLLEYLPADFEERFVTREGVFSSFSTLLMPAADEEQAKRDKQTVPAVKTPLPTNFKFSEVRYPFQTASILRGPSLFIREDHSNPLIEMGLFFPGGKLNENKENSGITRLMTSLMLRGGENIGQFYRQLEVYGGQVKPVVTDDYFGVYLSVLSQNFETAFGLLLEAIRNPSFDKEEVKRQAEIQISDILSGSISDKFPEEVINEALFEGFPYALNSYGSGPAVGSIAPESLKTWYDGYVKNRKPVVALIGDTKGTSLASVFVKNFSGSRMQEGKIPGSFAKSIEKGKTIELKWDRGQGMILIGFQAPPFDDEDGYATAVLQGLIGNQGRFAEEIRDRLGVAYEVSVVYAPRLRGGSLVVRAATSPGYEDRLLKALREEIQRVVDGPIPYRDFRSAVNEAMGTNAVQQQVRAAQIGRIAENVLSGRGIEGYQNFATGLQEVREEDFVAVTERLLNLDKAIIVVVRGQK